MKTSFSRALAQINIARMKAPMDHPRMKGFLDLIDRVNAIADASTGFVWRLQSDEGDATALRVFDDPLILINMSVWKSVDALHDFVYRSDHLAPFRERQRWFDSKPEPHMAMWWIPADHRPTAEEGRDRLDHLGRIGPTADAFTFARRYSPAGEPVATGTGGMNQG